MISYSVTIVTTHSVFDPRGIILRIQLIGETIQTEPVLLQRIGDGRNFEPGNTDTFRIRAQNIEVIKQIKIGFDETGFVEGWKLNEITVENLSTSKKHVYTHDGDLQKWHDGTLTLNVVGTTNSTCDIERRDEEDGEMVHFLMGPILGIRSLALKNEYQLCCLVMTSSDVHLLPPITFKYRTDDGSVSSHGSGEEVVLETLNDKRLWRYDWSVPRHNTKEISCTYYLPDGRCYTCMVPSKATPVRFVLASSADVSSSSYKDHSPTKNAMWTQMRREHLDSAFHLLIMAGDQINAGDLLMEKPSLVAWTQLSKKDRMNQDFTGQMRKETHDFYFDLYCERWRQPQHAWVYARVASLMMWNNLDILNGYGSMVSYPVIDGIYEVARKYFSLFQLRGLRQDKDWNSSKQSVSSPSCTVWLHPESGRRDDTKYSSLTSLIRLGEVAFLMLDGRSERTSSHIISIKTLQEISKLLSKLDNLKHLFVVSAIPFIHPDIHLFPNMETTLQVPWKREWEYDYSDSWESTVTSDVDRLRLLKLLADFSLRKKSRVSVLSGAVNAACWGKLYTETGVVINMPTSSPLVDEPLALLDILIAKLSSCVKDIEVPGHGISVSNMVPIGTEKDSPTILRTRNFITFTPLREKDELHYKSQVISETTHLFGQSGNCKPRILTNSIGPFQLEEKPPRDESICLVM